ncbi:16S rRNA (uracil1498-N3)-methyltransferase [Salinimicrobium catena]|uniref:Ribosomal RNA small subunit methyltransferase E n=1 Tax=Salinimicrobium catena TaxID=390640 RepID=A0A1H5LN14_9FLAO|nr:16S rRNA (uracil(1498)-N(3))-methyltransferase [Salinimicrobium catena]SDL11901.1 16S rRNA (uracil1498-N3)-methyltransferase [Salinimicrobium catena]SEE78432.1 16S rRNA (uracil1498-N3)-methyltransferase [Salinimicrobium catena]
MQLFYHPEVAPGDKEVVFPREESKHIVKVLRKKEGDQLHLTNGKGWLFVTELIAANQNSCTARVLSSEEAPPAPYHLHMVVAPTKMNDRYEWFLEKATEIGVQEITPVICDHSERKVVKLNRYERVLQSALKQSLHTRFPVLNEPVSFTELVEREIPGQKFIAHCEEDAEKNLLSKRLKKGAQVTILIGPEGDFSPDEISTALKNSWEAVSLGSSRLRTETAAIVACHTAALLNETE